MKEVKDKLGDWGHYAWAFAAENRKKRVFIEMARKFTEKEWVAFAAARGGLDDS